MNTDFIKLHIAVFLAGITGILGKLITMSAGPLVFWRVLITFIIFAIILKLRNKFPIVSRKDFVILALSGGLLAFHWIFFYASIKYANVSVAVVSFSLIGFFTAILEPIFTKSKFSPRELGLSLLIVCGVMLIFKLDTKFRTGMLLGITGAFIYACYTIVNKKISATHSSSTLLLYSMLGGSITLLLILPIYFNIFGFPESYLPSLHDFGLLLILSCACTIGMCLLIFDALKKISAFTVNLSFTLEPAYSIALSIIFLNEASDLSIAFFAGLSLIALSVCLQTVIVLRQKRQLEPLAEKSRNSQ